MGYSICLVAMVVTSLSLATALLVDSPLPEHPRLRVTDTELEKILGYIGTDETAKQYNDELVARGEEILKQPPAVRPPPGPSGILETVRVVLDRVYTMALLFRLTNNCNGTWLERGWKELEAAANFSDWNPHHFLDVGEMTHAVAIGYDWFYKDLFPDQKKTLETALATKGFEPAMKAFQEHSFWTYYPYNWNNVCNGGMIIGALALLDDENYGDLAKKMLNMSLHAITKAMDSYQPIGAWPEGAGYWSYATRYSVYAITALKTALGNDQGLGKYTGFEGTAEFEIHHTGPSMQIFNWADSHADNLHTSAKPMDTPEMFYLASTYGHPDAAFFQRYKIENRAEITPEDLINFTPSGTSADIQKLPRCQNYPLRNVIVGRSAWMDSNASWVGFKGGNVDYPHSHMDLGSFVLESKGQRWAIDLGADSYALPDYFGSKRWTYYRLRNIGHNTLTFDDDNMEPKAVSDLHNITCTSGGDIIKAVADLTEAYTPSHVKRVTREMTLSFSQRKVTFVDKIDAGESQAKEVTWGMHTNAEIDISQSGASMAATLSQRGETITVQVDAEATRCPDLVMSQEAVDLKPPQNPTTGVQKLLLKATAKTCTSLSVTLNF